MHVFFNWSFAVTFGPFHLFFTLYLAAFNLYFSMGIVRQPASFVVPNIFLALWACILAILGATMINKEILCLL